MNSKYFIYDGIKSSDKGIYIMRSDSKGTTPTWGSMNIDFTQIKNKMLPHHYSISREPLRFSIQIIVMDECGNVGYWTPEKIHEVGDWLITHTFKPFISSDDLGKVYYAMIDNADDLYTVNQQGYMTVDFITNSPFAWSNIEYSEFNMSDSVHDKNIVLSNNSNVLDQYQPMVEILSLKHNNNIEIINHTTGQNVKINKLEINEHVNIDNYNRIIRTDIPNKNIFKDFNRVWLHLYKGNNHIEIKGDCIIGTQMQFPIW